MTARRRCTMALREERLRAERRNHQLRAGPGQVRISFLSGMEGRRDCNHRGKVIRSQMPRLGVPKLNELESDHRMITGSDVTYAMDRVRMKGDPASRTGPILEGLILVLVPEYTKVVGSIRMTIGVKTPIWTYQAVSSSRPLWGPVFRGPT